jgi:hypothetical protein
MTDDARELAQRFVRSQDSFFENQLAVQQVQEPLGAAVWRLAVLAVR